MLRPIAVLLSVVFPGIQIAQAMPVAVEAQTTTASQAVAPGPIPAKVRTAKRVFVQSDAVSRDMYNRFVVALRTWGFTQLLTLRRRRM